MKKGRDREPGTREGKEEQGRDTYVLFALVLDDEEDEELLDVPVEGRGEVFVREMWGR